MIIGMGIDVEEVERVKGAMERQGERFLKRIFTEKERAYCEQFKDKYERYAGRFAVKEAAMKAAGAVVFDGSILKCCDCAADGRPWS
jgi:holo-[acyl-carrier protein] synthase